MDNIGLDSRLIGAMRFLQLLQSPFPFSCRSSYALEYSLSLSRSKVVHSPFQGGCAKSWICGQ